MTSHHLAQVNIAIPLEPLDSARLQGFVDGLESINALADAAPGFVWRLQTEDGDATSIRPYEDDSILINMSVWTSLESFADFVYGPAHATFMRRRREWFVPLREQYQALWWVPAGSLPTPADGVSRLDYLRAHGPSAFAFTVRQPFLPPGSAERPTVGDDWLCGV